MHSKNAPYLNRIYKNLKGVRKTHVKTVLENLKESNCIIPVGEGRSECALYIGLSRINKIIKTPEDIDFPGNTVHEAAEELERRYGKIALLVNSGSGETLIPRKTVQMLSEYIEKSCSKKYTINAIVSNPMSSIGMIREKSYGYIIELRGRKTEPKTEQEYYKLGIMNDIYELGSLMLIHRMKLAINRNKSYKFVLDVDTNFKEIYKIVDDFTEEEIYRELVDSIERRCHVTVGGLGPARIVALMTVIRLQHVKRSVGDEAYISGPLAPHPRAGDVLLLISRSGENDALINWCEQMKKSGVQVYSIVGRDSTLSSISNSFVLDCREEDFYCYAAYALSPLPLSVVKKLASHGLRLPEYILRWYHSVTQ